MNALLKPIAIAAFLPAVATAANVTVSFTNNGNSDFFLTPLFAGFHNGTVDTFNPGEMASAGLEALAEDGIVNTLGGELQAAQSTAIFGAVGNPAGFGGAPVVDPGETATVSFTGLNTTANRYFNFASMIIPSNDAFIANGNPLAFELFDANGVFNGPITINVFYNQVWDAGTEVNDTMGAAFGTVGGTSSDEGGAVALLPSGGLNNFQGTGTAAGTTINNLFTMGEQVATITIVPEPSSALLGLVASLVGITRRRR